jgi:hypothetical protein
LQRRYRTSQYFDAVFKADAANCREVNFYFRIILNVRSFLDLEQGYAPLILMLSVFDFSTDRIKFAGLI